MPGMFDRDKLASEMTHEARDDTRVTFADIIYSLLGTTAEESAKRRAEWGGLFSNPSEVANQLSNWPDPRMYTAGEPDFNRTSNIIGNAAGAIPVLPGMFIGPKGVRKLGLLPEMERAKFLHDKMQKFIERKHPNMTPRQRQEYLWDKLAPFWFGSPDKIPRMEISDASARIRADRFVPDNPPITAGGVPETGWESVGTSVGPATIYRGKLGDILEHPRLFDAYPEFQDIPVEVLPNVEFSGKSWGGYFQSDPAPGKIGLVSIPTMSGRGLAGGLNRYHPLFHETMHAVQNKEGMARGGYGMDFLSPKRIAELRKKEAIYDEVIDTLRGRLVEREKEMFGSGWVNAKKFDADKEVVHLRNMIREHENKFYNFQQELLNKGYMENAGEAEARAVETRLGRDLMFPEIAMDMPPESLFDPSIEDLFVNFR